MKNSKKIMYAVVAVIVLAGVFFGGYWLGKKSAPGNKFGGQDFAAMRNGLGGNFTSSRQNGGADRGMNRGGFTVGTVMSVADNMITLNTQNGGSKVIIYSSSTPVSKTVDGAFGDIKVGDNIMVRGDSATGGPVTAQTIQLMPPSSTPAGAPRF